MKACMYTSRKTRGEYGYGILGGMFLTGLCYLLL